MQNKKSKIIDLRKQEKRESTNFKTENEFKFRTFSESKIKKEKNKTNKLSKKTGSLFVLFKKRSFKYSLLGIVSIILISVVVFTNFKNLTDFKESNFSNKDQEVSQFLTLKNTSGNTVAINNKSSLHIPFIKNQGQIEQEKVKYYAPIFLGNVFVTNEFLKYSIESESEVEPESEQKTEDSSIKSKVAFSETFLNSEGDKIVINPEGQNKSQTTTSYFQGNDLEKWKSNVETNDSIHLGELYNRIDIHLRAYANNVEKLFIVDSGGNADEIIVKIDGVDNMEISDKGEIIAFIGNNKVALTKPIAYQEIEEDGKKTKRYIATNYTLNQDNNTYGFSVGDYNHTKPLIIDPLLSSTYLGGASDEMYSYDDFGGRIYNGHKSIVEDGDGNIYVIGETKSDDYPSTVGVIDEDFNDTSSILKNDIVISKFNSDLTQLLSSTYLGGTSEDVGSSLVIDGSDLYVTGFTRSNDFPTTGGAHSTTFNGGNSDIFISKLNTDLTTLQSSTYVGGVDKEFAYSLIEDGSNLYLAGDTYSSNFPTRVGAYDNSFEGSSDGFVLQITNDLTTINYTTFIGGSNADYTRRVLKLNSNIILAGQTTSTDFPGSPGTFQGDTDGYIASLSTDLSTLNNATYFGGSQNELVSSFVVDSSDDIIVVGSTDSTDFSGATSYQSSNAGHYDGFIAKFNSSLTQTVATYIGGVNQDDIYEVDIDSNDYVYIVGQTYSDDYPTTQYAWDDTRGGNADGFISKFTNDLATLDASTYFGGDGNIDYILSTIISGNGDEDIIIKGITNSSETSFPVTAGAYDVDINGSRDIFVSRLTNDLRQNAWPDHVEVKYENPADTFNTSLNTLAGETKTLTIFLKDPSGNTVTEDSYDGDYNAILSGAADSPHGHHPTCTNNLGSPINFGSNTILTFTDGVATCDAIFYGAEIASIDAQVTISATPYDSTGSVNYDLDVTVDHNVMSEIGSSIDAVVNPTIVEDNVDVTVTVNDEWGNPLGIDGISQAVVINVTGENTATPTVTDESDGTYTSTYTTGTSAGTDLITATLNTISLQYDEDGTPDGTYNLPLHSQVIHHFALRYENPVDTYNDSLNATVGTIYTLAMIAEDQYGNPVNDYDGYHYITVTGANNSPYGDIPFCGTSSSQKLGQSNRYTFNDGIAKCNLTLYNAESVQLEGTDGSYTTTGSDAYDLDVVAVNTTHDHMKITDDSDANNITATAGITTGIKVSARDVYGNFIATYDGDHDITFSGMNASFNGTISTVNDKIISPINFGTATTLTFTDGEAVTNMDLYTRENAEIEVTDDTTHDSISDPDFDLNAIISSQGAVNASESTIGVSQDPAGTCGAEGIFVVVRDNYGNQLETGGNTVTLTITGTNPNSFSTPATITDNGDGTYVANYSPATGNDQITGTID